MSLQPCPITGAFLKEVWVRMGESPATYEDLNDACRELSELAAENYPDDTALALRGLYLTESLYFSLLPDLARRRGWFSPEQTAEMKQRRFPRSVEGMYHLVEYLDELREDTLVADYARELAGMSTESMRAWSAAQRDNWEAVLKITLYCTVSMEGALANRGVHWARIGSNYGLATTHAAMTVDNCLEQARTLLSININHGPHPWNLSTSSRG